MAKSKSQFVCSECGYSSTRWMGKCPECNAWNSFVEESLNVGTDSAKAKGARSLIKSTKPIKLSDITLDVEDRMMTGIEEFDRVLGGGIMRGSLVLIGGDPGIGKSTLLLQVCKALLTAKTLYVSGEESPRQLKSRAERLLMSNEDIYLLAETNIEQIIEHAELLKPDVLIVDSIQTTYRSMLDSAPGVISFTS